MPEICFLRAKLDAMRHGGRMKRWAISPSCRIFVACVILGACAYSDRFPELVALDEAHLFGYSERALGGDRFEVSYLTREQDASLDDDERDSEASRAKAKARDFALWRATMLAVDQGFPAFSVLDSRFDVDVMIDDEGAYFGGAACSSYGFGCGSAYDRDFREAWLQARAVIDVQMHNEPVEGAYSVDATARRLGSRYPDARIPPNQGN